MKKFLVTALFFFTTYFSHAQTIRIADSREFLFSDFYVAIVAGVLLALIFQIVLTALSVAMGITMIGNVKKKYAESQAKLESERGTNEYLQEKDDDDLSGVQFSSAFGVWSLITTTISLFGACALALNLSFFGTMASNLTIGLVIWALFYMILFYLEAKIVHTLIGGLITTATAGLKFSAGIVKDLFKKSPSNKAVHSIENRIQKIRKDFELDPEIMIKILEGFLVESRDANSQAENLNYRNLRNDLNKVLDNPKETISSVKSMVENLDEKTIKTLIKNNAHHDENDVSKITAKIIEVVDELKNKIFSIEQKINKEVKITKRKGILQAEHARKTAASAAWWLVLTVVFSGMASMLGAYLELID